MASTSFGLTPEYKLGIQKQIFDLVDYTKGGIGFEEAYFIMPVYLRNFYYNELVNTLRKEADAVKGVAPKKGWQPPPDYAFGKGKQ